MRNHCEGSVHESWNSGGIIGRGNLIDKALVFLFSDSTLEFNGDNDNKPVLCKLRHPRTGK
jgi:hypothetical protein